MWPTFCESNDAFNYRDIACQNFGENLPPPPPPPPLDIATTAVRGMQSRFELPPCSTTRFSRDRDPRLVSASELEPSNVAQIKDYLNFSAQESGHMCCIGLNVHEKQFIIRRQFEYRVSHHHSSFAGLLAFQFHFNYFICDGNISEMPSLLWLLKFS